MRRESVKTCKSGDVNSTCSGGMRSQVKINEKLIARPSANLSNLSTYYYTFPQKKFLEVVLHLGLVYSLCQKKCTFNSDFFCGRPIRIVNYVNGSSIHAKFYMMNHVNFCPPPPPGWQQKNSELYVRCFWHRLYSPADHGDIQKITITQGHQENWADATDFSFGEESKFKTDTR